METTAEYQVITSVSKPVIIYPTYEMTLDQLKAVEEAYRQMAAADYHDLLMIVLALGEVHVSGYYKPRVFETDNITVVHTIKPGLFDTVKNSYSRIHEIIASVGDPEAALGDGAVIRRKTHVCRIFGIECAGENKPDIGPDTFYRPGLWRDKLFENLHRAHVVINARKNDKTEQERIALAERLLAGITI